MLFVDEITGSVYEGNKKHMEGCRIDGGKPRKIKSSQLDDREVFDAPNHWLHMQNVDDRY